MCRKNLILLLVSLLLYACQESEARMSLMILGGGRNCDSCSGAVLHTWHAENSGDVTVGTPCGCSDSDTTGTHSGTPVYSGTASDGSYSLALDTDAEYMAYTAIIAGEGTICAKIYATFSEFTDSTEIFAWYKNGNNYTSMYLDNYSSNTVDATLLLRANGDDPKIELYEEDIPVTDSTWMAACISWDINESAGSDTFWVWLDGNADGVMDAAETAENTSGTSSEMTDYSGSFYFGSSSVYIDGAADFLIDDMYADTTYRNAAFTW